MEVAQTIVATILVIAFLMMAAHFINADTYEVTKNGEKVTKVHTAGTKFGYIALTAIVFGFVYYFAKAAITAIF